MAQERQRQDAEPRRQIAVVVHRVDPDNIGDTICAPNHPDYENVYPWLQGAPEIDLRSGIIANLDLLRNSAVVIGGGGLFGNTVFKRQMETLLNEAGGKVVVFGAGKHGSIALGSPTPETEDPRFLDRFDLIGMRDWPARTDLGHVWCPCPSIRHPLIDQYAAATPQHDAVIFDHRDHPIDIPRTDIPGNLRLDNTASEMERVLEHISKGRVLVTTSYHGALWAKQMGRAVAVPCDRAKDGTLVPWSSKLVEDRYQPALFVVSEGGWRQAVEQAQTYPQARAESLEAQDQFIAEMLRVLQPELEQLGLLRQAGELPLPSTTIEAPTEAGRLVPTRVYTIQPATDEIDGENGPGGPGEDGPDGPAGGVPAGAPKGPAPQGGGSTPAAPPPVQNQPDQSTGKLPPQDQTRRPTSQVGSHLLIPQKVLEDLGIDPATAPAIQLSPGDANPFLTTDQRLQLLQTQDAIGRTIRAGYFDDAFDVSRRSVEAQFGTDRYATTLNQAAEHYRQWRPTLEQAIARKQEEARQILARAQAAERTPAPLAIGVQQPEYRVREEVQGEVGQDLARRVQELTKSPGRTGPDVRGTALAQLSKYTKGDVDEVALVAAREGGFAPEQLRALRAMGVGVVQTKEGESAAEALFRHGQQKGYVIDGVGSSAPIEKHPRLTRTGSLPPQPQSPSGDLTDNTPSAPVGTNTRGDEKTGHRVNLAPIGTVGRGAGGSEGAPVAKPLTSAPPRTAPAPPAEEQPVSGRASNAPVQPVQPVSQSAAQRADGPSVPQVKPVKQVGQTGPEIGGL